MSQPNKREEEDIDPRQGKNQGSPLENANPTARNFQRPNADNNKIPDKNLNKKAGSEHQEEEEQDTSGAA